MTNTTSFTLVTLAAIVLGLHVQGHGATSVHIISQNLSHSAIASLYQPAPFGGDELVVSRTANDESSVVGSRFSGIEVTAQANGVNQVIMASTSVVVSNSPVHTLFEIHASASATFTNNPQAVLRTGKSMAQLGMFSRFWVSLDRPHNLSLNVLPSGPLSLNGSVTISVDSIYGGANSSSTIALNSPVPRSLFLQLGRGEHFLSVQMSVGGTGAFSLDEGYVTPVEGESALAIIIEMQAVGYLPFRSGRVHISASPDDATLVLNLSDLTPGKYYYLEQSKLLFDAPWEAVRSFYAVSATATLHEPFDAKDDSGFYRLRLID